MPVSGGLSIEIYSSGSTRIIDPDNLLARAEGIRFATCYPGGIFTTASFFIPMDVTRSITIKHAQRCIIRDGLRLVWEGWIAEIDFKVDPVRSGIEVSCLGYWAALFHQYKYNRWIDRRYSANTKDVWVATVVSANDKCSFDKQERLMFLPKSEAWASGEYAMLRYYLNGASNAKRVKFTYDLQEGAQAWELILYDADNSACLFTTASSGAAAADITLSPTSAHLQFRLYARANQTPTSSSVYGKITNLSVLAENSSGNTTTTPTAILQSCTDAAYSGGVISTCTHLIGSNTYDLTDIGIVDDGFDRSIAGFMLEVAKLSNDGTKWNIGVRESEAGAGETKAILFYEEQPALTDYDYVLSIDEHDVLVGGFDLVSSAMPGDTLTRAIVKFRDTRGIEDWNYADSTLSVSRIESANVVTADNSITTLAAASAYAERIIAAKQNLVYYVGSPVTIKGHIRAKTGERVPASWVRAGERLKIENFLQDFGDESAGTGFTFLISQTEYDDRTETNRLTLGRPDSAALTMARTMYVGCDG